MSKAGKQREKTASRVGVGKLVGWRSAIREDRRKERSQEPDNRPVSAPSFFQNRVCASVMKGGADRTQTYTVCVCVCDFPVGESVDQLSSFCIIATLTAF